MALTFTTGLRDQVSLITAGRPYSQLNSGQQTSVDGAGARALARISRWADFVAFAGADDDAPEEWGDWLVALAASMAAQHLDRSRADDLRREAGEAMQMALRSFSRTVSTDTGSTDLALDTLTVRRHVVSRCVDRESPVFPSFDVVDSAIKQELTRIWNDAAWAHEEVLVTLTVGADSTVTAETADGTAVSLDRITRDVLRYADGRGVCQRSDVDTVLAARVDPDRAPGRPEFFVVRQNAQGLTWMFAPEPDAEYELLADAVLRTPAMADRAGVDAALALFPPEYGPIILDTVLAKVLRDIGVRDGHALYREARDDLAMNGPGYDATAGEPRNPVGPLSRRRGLGRAPGFFGSPP